MSEELDKVAEMQKQVFDALHLLGMKKLLSNRKNKDGSNSYQKTLDRVEEAECKLKKKEN